MNEGHYVFEIDGVKTLPLFVLMGRTTETIPGFGSARMNIEFVDPTYEPFSYEATPETLNRLGASVDDATKAAKRWPKHSGTTHT